jgi:FUN14 family.
VSGVEVLVGLLPPLAGGAVLGFLIRKGIKLLAGIAGLFLVSLAALESLGYVKVDWQKLGTDLYSFFKSLFERLTAMDWTGFAAQGAPLAGFGGGFALGWWLASKV